MSNHAEIELMKQILQNDKSVELLLVKLYYRQDADEAAMHITKWENARGFNRIDAEFLTSLAEQAIKKEHSFPLGERLSTKQHEIARKKLVKYHKQLIQIIEQEATDGSRQDG